MNDQKIVTIVQARTGSTRLPGKVLLSICGQPLLFRMLDRVKFAELIGKIVVAASDLPQDDIIEKLCRENRIDCYRGHPDDLLDRHYKTAKLYNADAVVKIPSDCPLIDPRIIDKVIQHFLSFRGEADYVSNLHPATFPDGNDVEIISFRALEEAWQTANKDFEREHTTPYIWENPDKFKIANIEWETGLDFSFTHRWTIDYEEDYIFIRNIFEELYYKKPCFSLYDILNLIEEKKYLTQINNKYAGRYWYENHLSDLHHIDEFKRKQSKVKYGQS